MPWNKLEAHLMKCQYSQEVNNKVPSPVLEACSSLESIKISEKFKFLKGELQDLETRLHHAEKASYDGVLIWKIDNFRKKKEEAVRRQISLYSEPFYTSRYGYKVCGRVFLNGNGMGRDTHLSFYFVLMRGEFDALLQWPFPQKVLMTLIDQEAGKNDIVDFIYTRHRMESLERPTAEKNSAIGLPCFAKQHVVESLPYLKDDCIFLKIQIEPPDVANK